MSGGHEQGDDEDGPQRALLRAMLARPSGGAGVVAVIEEMLTDVVRSELRALADVSGAARAPLDLVAPAVMAAFVAALTWWIGEDFGHTPEQMDAYFQTLLAPGVRATLPPAVLA